MPPRRKSSQPATEEGRRQKKPRQHKRRSATARGGTRGRGRGRGRPRTRVSEPESDDNSSDDENAVEHQITGFDVQSESKSSPGSQQTKLPRVEPQVITPTPEQAEALRRAIAGESLFITGPGGVGKTDVLCAFADGCRLERKATVTVLATTSTSRARLNAMPLEFWLSGSFSRARHPTEEIPTTGQVADNFRETDVVIIDDISGMTAAAFTTCDAIGRKVRDATKPWGGIQVVAAGCFTQIAPTPGSGFAFQSPAWATLFPPSQCITFTHNFRNPTPELQTLLNHLQNKDLVNAFQIIGRHRPTNSTPRRPAIPARPVAQRLPPLRVIAQDARAERYNMAMFQKLIPTEKVKTVKSAKTYRISCSCTFFTRDQKPPPLETARQLRTVADMFRDGLPCPKKLRLIIGCVVMLIRNSTNHIAGDRGIVRTFFENKPDCPIVEFERTGLQETITQYQWQYEVPQGSVHCDQLPLVLAWSISVRGLQGLALTGCDVHLPPEHAQPNQLSTILAKLSCLDNTAFWSVSPKSAALSPAVNQFLNRDDKMTDE